MAMDIEVRGLRAAMDKASRRKRKLANLRGANLAAAMLVEAWTLRNMTAEGALHEDAGLRWPPLKRSTLRRRAQAGQAPGPMLRVTGRLKRGFRASADHRIGRVRNPVAYAVHHEVGTRGVPRRKLFPTSAQGRGIALPAYQRHVAGALR